MAGEHTFLGLNLSHEFVTIANVSVAVAIALLGGLLAHAARQSPIVGYLLAGMLIGPFASNVIGERETIAALAEVGVIFLMFALGIEFSLKELARVRDAAVFGTMIQLLLVGGAGFGLGMLLGWPVGQSLFFGGAISVSSTMVIIKTLMNRGEMEAPHGRLLLGMLIVQDLAVVVLMLLLPRLTSGSEHLWRELLIAGIKSVGFVGATLFLGAKIIPRWMAAVERLHSPELFILTAVTLALATATVSGLLGLSAPLGAFMAGIMLTETEFDHRVVAEIVPMRDIFATLFFVSIGMLVDLKFILQNFPQVLGIAAFIVTIKFLGTLLALGPFRPGGKTAIFTATGMVSIGEFTYVLAHQGTRSGVLPESIADLILGASILTIVLTPSAFWSAPRIDRALGRFSLWNRWSEPRGAFAAPETVPLSDQAIVIGYGRVGRRMARGLKQAGLPVIVIDQDIHLVQQARGRGILAIYGDASSVVVLKAARPAHARIIVVALPDFGATRAVVHRARDLNPKCLIVARAQRSENDVKLREAGATTVVVPEIAGALMLLEETLLLLGLPHEHIFTGVHPLPETVVPPEPPTPAPASDAPT